MQAHIKTDKKYTNLPKGNYISKVKTKNIYEKESLIAQYWFVILTPWNNTYITYIIYGLIAFIFIWLIVKFNTRRLKKGKDKLEKTVKERTIEISRQKEEIQAQAEYLACVNKELEKLSIIVQETDNAVILANPDGHIEWVNEGFYKLYRYSLSRFIDKTGNNIFKTNHNPDIKNIVERCLEHKESITYENRFTCKTGKKIWIQTTLTPIINDNGQAEKLIAIDSDITKLKEAENKILAQNDELEIHRKHLEKLVKKRTAELEKAKERAEESDRLKSAFLANMSHEIRTPMNGIMGFASLLKDPDLSHENKLGHINIISDNCQQLLTIIKDIIDVSKMETGQIEIINEEFDATEIINANFNYYKDKCNQKGIELIQTFQIHGAKKLLYSDKDKISRVLNKLLDNAVKFTHKGKIEIGASYKTGHIEFFVRDTGIGIDSGIKKKIFECFHQAETGMSRTYEGTGLGLTIVKGFLDRMRGNIWVESEIGNLPAGKAGGSVFYFTIPYENMLEKENANYYLNSICNEKQRKNEL